MRVQYALLALVAAASPAFADHPGPSGVGGGSINVIAPDTLEDGAFALGARLTYLRPQQRSDAELQELAERHIHAHGSDYNLIASAGLAYGLTGHLTLSLELPYVRRDDLREGTHDHAGEVAVNGVEPLGTIAGIGDATLLARYSLVDRPGAMFTLIGGVKAPTGSTHARSLAGERLETEHQPGTGSWDPIAGASFGAPLGPLRFTASALYQWSGRGAQQTRLGDRAQTGIALSRRFGPAGHHDQHEEEQQAEAGEHPHDAHHAHRSWDAFVELTGEWEGRQEIQGAVEDASGGRSIWLSPGARFNSAAGLSAAVGFGIPVWQRIRSSHPENKYRLTLSIGRAF